MYRVANESQYLAITGYLIADIKIAKKSWVFPWQSCTILDVSPVNYTFNVQATSAEELPFVLPAVFTIGPKADELECLLKYARLVSANAQQPNHVNDLVQGVIERETSALAASMSVEAIFQGINEFKKQVLNHVQLELDLFGLLIYNANVKQPVDVPGHEYFSYVGTQIEAIEAANQARVHEAEVRMKAEVIVTRCQGEGQKEMIKVQAEVKIFEIEMDAEVAAKKASYIVADVEAVKAVALRKAELQKEVETINALTRTKKLKGEFLTKASVDYETKVQKANGLFYQKQKEAEAFLFEEEKKAEAQKVTAAAALFSKMKEADGELYSQLKEAEGTVALGQAQGTYLRTLLDSLNGNYTALREYRGLIQDMAKL